ncbi:MAG: hypothetical protein ACXWKN_03200 [Phenylobacterium sp.]
MRKMAAMTCLALALAFGAPVRSQQSPRPDLYCRYTNGSSAFSVYLASHRTSGDMVSDQLSVSDAQIVFDVSAARTTLLQAFHIIIDRASLKWTTDKPGWAGTCSRTP